MFEILPVESGRKEDKTGFAVTFLSGISSFFNVKTEFKQSEVYIPGSGCAWQSVPFLEHRAWSDFLGKMEQQPRTNDKCWGAWSCQRRVDVRYSSSSLIFTVKVPGDGVAHRSSRSKVIGIRETFLGKWHERYIWVTGKLLTNNNSINKNKGMEYLEGSAVKPSRIAYFSGKRRGWEKCDILLGTGVGLVTPQSI